MSQNKITLKIYIEGGDKGKDIRARFQEAWTKFFQAAGLEGKMPRIVTGRGRGQTFDLFSTARQHRSNDEMPLLLLDSEDAVAHNKTVWQHLKDRDGFTKPSNASEEHSLPDGTSNGNLAARRPGYPSRLLRKQIQSR